MTKFTKLKATVAPMVLGIAMVSVPAFAQGAGAADDQPGELIVVTGSRIASATVESAAPL